MKCLFIIGNGFDREHRLPTSYQDFRNYLTTTYPISVNINIGFEIEAITYPDGGERYNALEVVKLLLDVIDEAELKDYNEEIIWSDFETSLGKLNLEVYLDDAYILLENKDDKSLFRMPNIYEDISKNLYNVVSQIKELFAEWINNIDTLKCEIKSNLINFILKNEVKFFSFNYTRTLEDVYDVCESDIKYIHGAQFTKEIIVGHGEEIGEIENAYLGSEGYLEDLQMELKKDTTLIIENNQDYFKELQHIEAIYSFGFSFSEVDLPYINEIFKNIKNEKIVWHLSDYDDYETKENYKKIIQSCGFKGNFREFNLDSIITRVFRNQ